MAECEESGEVEEAGQEGEEDGEGEDGEGVHRVMVARLDWSNSGAFLLRGDCCKRPRSIDRGKPAAGRYAAALAAASMRPRSIDRGKSHNTNPSISKDLGGTPRVEVHQAAEIQ